MEKNNYHSTLNIAVTGGAGNIAYHLLFHIASGEVFGKERKISLRILEIPNALKTLDGIKMELFDCAFPLLEEVIISSDPEEVFDQADLALLIGSKPRGPGMERKDLLLENAKIFIEQGRALNNVAKSHTKILVVGNPCNTNCLIALKNAPKLNPKNFHALTRLDQNRGTALLAQKCSCPVTELSRLIIWGNHSNSQVPDPFHAQAKGQMISKLLPEEWLLNEFIEIVQQRGAKVIQAKGSSSAGSAAKAIADAAASLMTPSNHWTSSAVYSNGNPYGIEEDLIFSFPTITDDQLNRQIVEGLTLHPAIKERIKLTEHELVEERQLAMKAIGARR